MYRYFQMFDRNITQSHQLKTYLIFVDVRNVVASIINVKNFHASLTTGVMAQNDTSKTANITDTIFDRTSVLWPLQATAFSKSV